MSKRVLLHVEDEDAAVFLLKTALEESNIDAELHRVSDGEQALAFLRRAGAYAKAPVPDLILLDLNLPRATGFDVLESLARDNSLPRPRTVVFTSSSLPSDREKALQLGASDFVTKPANLDHFIQAVASICGFLASSEAA